MKNIVGKKNLDKKELIFNISSYSPIVEAYRNLRSNLNFLSPDKDLKSISFTSCEPGDGKTLTTINLAISMANNNQKVILIDGDLRRPKLHSILNLTSFDGLSDVLSGDCRLDEAIRKHEVDNLLVIPAGSIPPNPSELISSKKMRDLIEKAKDKADIVLIDSPPISLSDSAILGNIVDGSILVVQSHYTKENQVREAIDRLTKANSKILGTVLNFHPIKKLDGYYGDYYN